MTKRRLLSILGLCAVASAALAQAPIERGEVPGLVGLRLQRLGIEQGLSQASARTMAQDGEGMLWIGTQDGLNRYDGEDFLVFRRDPQDRDGLSDNHITALATDTLGRLWVGTQAGGLGRYDPDGQRFKNYPVAPGRADALAAVPVQAIAQASDGQLWIASGRGHLQRLNTAGTRFEDIAMPSDVQVRAVLPLPDGDMLIGGTQGLWRWHASEDSLRSWARETADLQPDIQALARGADGRIWAGSAAHGAFELAPDGRMLRRLTRRHGLAGNDIRSLLSDNRGRLWIGTYTGLSRIDAADAAPRTWVREERRNDGLSSDRVHSLLQDRDGLVWIGTWLGGAHVYLPGTETFREYRSVANEPRALPGNAVRCVVPDPDGSLWLGVQEGGGLVNFDPAYGVRQRYSPQADSADSLASDRVQAIARGLDGDLWVGFVDAGLDRLRQGQATFEHFAPDPKDPRRPRDANVLSLYVDRAGTLWVGFQDLGMDALCRGCGEFTRYAYRANDPRGLPGQAIGAVFESSRGELWVGARPGGLARLDRASGIFTPLEELLAVPQDVSPRSITTITESRNGDLWIGTQGSGIVQLKPTSGGRYRSRGFTHKDGLAAEAIGSIVEDAKGSLWISTTLGISRLDPIDGRIENFSARAGAQAEGYFVNAGAMLDDGRIVYGGLRGLTFFDPTAIASRGVLHRPAITSVRSFQTTRAGEVDWTYRRRGEAPDQLWLRAGSGGFGFSFSALAFADPDLVQYSYRLDPIDRNWTDASAAQRNAGYPHLAPGDYRLRLRARFPGEDYSPERQVDVRLDPLWWQSGWARGAFAMALFVPFAIWGWNRRQHGIERAQAQSVLEESEQRLKLALWGTGDEFWDADMRSGRLVRVNPLRHLRVTQEVPELTFSELVPRIHEADRETFTQKMQTHARGESEEFDCVYRLQDAEGPDWCWVRSRGRTVERDAKGHPLRMAGVTEDITELREYERTLERVNQELEERVGQRTSDLLLLNKELVTTIDKLKLTQHQLVESEKLAALGGLVAGIAHEVNTPLGIGVTAASHLEQQARVFAQQLDAGTAGPEQLAAFRNVVLESSALVLRNLQRADKMIRSFKQVAVDQASEQPRRIDVRAYFDEILISLQPTLKRRPHKLELDIEPDLVVLTHPGALYQILVNLVMNSLTHGFAERDGGTIRIAAKRDGEAWILDYADDGNGMNDDVRRHIFEPFFTTKRGQGGSGLGMHIVYNLAVQALGGSIALQTELGKGARFVLRIPLRDAVATAR